jgi:hypothetical protein
MRINGEWLLCDDGVVRPVFRAELLASDGAWRAVELLADIGADGTVLTADILSELGLPLLETGDRLSGLGGATDSVEIETRLQLRRDAGNPVVFTSRFAAVTDPTALELCVLGRDLTDLFAVIVDRPGDVVCLLSQRHRYAIIQD